MTALWIPILLGVAVVAILILTRWRYRLEMAELGTVSQHWLAEQRANDRHYSER
jgi:hypothetical protein